MAGMPLFSSSILTPGDCNAVFSIDYISVVVSLLDVAKGVNKTLYFLSRGDSFGELALVNQARREITVVSKEHVELLVLNGEVGGSRGFLSGRKSVEAK